MAKLYFRYSAMNAGKSLDLLKNVYNYEEHNKKVLLLTSSIDNRYGVGKITTRVGLQKDATIVNNKTNIVELFLKEECIDCVFVDEAQFLKKHHIMELCQICDTHDIPVICYGLRSDFKLEPFEGSKYLLALADTIEEIKTICWCGKKATINARISNGKIIKKGEQILVGGNETHVALCRKHYFENKLNYR